MTNQSKSLCPVCGNKPVSQEHHLIKRGVAPELIDDPRNKLAICGDCHYRTEIDQKFYEALQQIFFYWRPGNVDLFLRAQASLDSLFTGEPIDYVTPGMCDHYLTLAQSGYAFYSERMGELEQAEAKYFIDNKNDETTNTELKMEFAASEEGQEKIALSRRLKALEKTMSGLRSKMARFREERFNQNH